MTYSHLDKIEAREIIPGFHGKLVHGDSVSMVFWQIDAGAELPEHAHVHEQITTVLEGELEMTIDGETRVLLPGAVVVIASNTPHAGRARIACRVIDVFHPTRDDYR